jgi:tRNA1Val (adenine37-N6)-methyltransferase
MSNSYFRFKQFIIHQDRCAMKVTTDACLFGAWAASDVRSQMSDVRRMLDVGTGTGLLSLMLAQKNDANIDAIEIDKDAFEQAKENILASPWKERINIDHVDARNFSALGKYDIIISNPPFYENELKSPDEKRNIAHHGGLLLKDLLEIISQNLDRAGHFYLLLPPKRVTELDALLPSHGLKLIQSVWVRQSVVHDYFRVFVKGSSAQNNEKQIPEKELSIWNEKKEYTDEFIELLKDYYLYL